MTTPEFPDDESLEAMRRAADSVASSPGMRAALEAARQMSQWANSPAVRAARDAAALMNGPVVRAARDAAALMNGPVTQAARDAAAIGTVYQRHLQANARMYQQMAAATALSDTQRALVNQAVRYYGRTLRQQWTETSRIALTFDTTGLDRLLGDLAAWRTLGDQAQASVAQVLEEAYETAESGTAADDVPDEAVACFEEIALRFASSDADVLTPKAMRAAFIWFCGGLVLISAMTLAFTSDTTDAVLGKALEYIPLAAAAMAAARMALDRSVGSLEGGGGENQNGDRE
ncbi:hypothetical protein ACFZAR_39410 [Streptomyces sp. NPDC008222]|uniref:hypothetical protein n=1 Tax=Streptomyces sp. NPDC008222 TaxID=3364820 RepID=UPI0036F17E14